MGRNQATHHLASLRALLVGHHGDHARIVAVDALVPIVVAQDAGDVAARFPEGNQVEEERHVLGGVATPPLGDAPGTGVVSGKGILDTAELLDQAAEELHAELGVDLGVVEVVLTLAGNMAGGGGQKLQEPARVGT